MDDKGAYRHKLEARLDQWRAEIDKLEARAAELGADARIEYGKQIDALREKQQKARASLDRLESASGEAWKDLRSGIEAAWDDLGRAVRTATDRFS